MIKLHFADKELKGDIPCYQCENITNVIDIVRELTKENEKLVYLLTVNDGDDIVIVVHDWDYVIEWFYTINERVEKAYYKRYPEIFVQIYDSYEAAYSVALAMSESTGLAYKR